MYETIVYFAGPLSVWSGKPHPREIIARRSSRWQWLALVRAQAVLAAVDSGRCGFVVTRNGEVIHHERAKDEQCNPLASEEMHFEIDAHDGMKECAEQLPEILRKNNEELERKIAEDLRPA
jgi:dsDNA-binding SOS-regulon protein